MEDNQEGRQNAEGSQRSKPWGFVLVLAAIVVVAVVYSVTIFTIGGDVTSEAAFGAMAACFTIIGTLVGTYFGVKAGLDAQDRVRETLARAGDRSRERPQDSAERDRDRSRERRPDRERQPEEQRGSREYREQRRGEPDERQEWEKVGV